MKQHEVVLQLFSFTMNLHQTMSIGFRLVNLNQVNLDLKFYDSFEFESFQDWIARVQAIWVFWVGAFQHLLLVLGIRVQIFWGYLFGSFSVQVILNLGLVGLRLLACWVVCE